MLWLHLWRGISVAVMPALVFSSSTTVDFSSSSETGGPSLAPWFCWHPSFLLRVRSLTGFKSVHVGRSRTCEKVKPHTEVRDIFQICYDFFQSWCQRWLSNHCQWYQDDLSYPGEDLDMINLEHTHTSLRPTPPTQDLAINADWKSLPSEIDSLLKAYQDPRVDKTRKVWTGTTGLITARIGYVLTRQIRGAWLVLRKLETDETGNTCVHVWPSEWKIRLVCSKSSQKGTTKERNDKFENSTTSMFFLFVFYLKSSLHVCIYASHTHFLISFS